MLPNYLLSDLSKCLPKTVDNTHDATGLPEMLLLNDNMTMP